MEAREDLWMTDQRVKSRPPRRLRRHSDAKSGRDGRQSKRSGKPVNGKLPA
jgi:hypothetical protein